MFKTYATQRPDVPPVDVLREAKLRFVEGTIYKVGWESDRLPGGTGPSPLHPEQRQVRLAEVHLGVTRPDEAGASSCARSLLPTRVGPCRLLPATASLSWGHPSRGTRPCLVRPMRGGSTWSSSRGSGNEGARRPGTGGLVSAQGWRVAALTGARPRHRGEEQDGPGAQPKGPAHGQLSSPTQARVKPGK